MNIKINPEDLKVMQNLYPGGENPVFRGEYTPEVKKLTFPSGYSVNRGCGSRKRYYRRSLSRRAA